MTIHVPEILTKAAAKRDRVTPVDIVMGDHWAEIDLGNPIRLSLLRHMLKKQQSGGRAGGSQANRTSLRIPLEVVRRSPQAMVKVIKNGGTTNARGMRDQMSYLEKDGDAVLERSERYFGTELAEEDQEALIEAWGLAGETNTNSDKTTHFVVSFPRDTDHGAAYRAGRAWAEEMFAKGTYGDVYDYYTAFHTDRAHPHIHVVVNRRGMEHGDWLKVSRRSQFNYDEFRAVQVEVAAIEGIILEATPRLARGIAERPTPDAEIRKAEKERREPKPPAHTPVTAIRAAATIALYSEQMSADANLLKERHPELAKAMKSVATAIAEGRHLLARPSNRRPALTIEEAKKQSEYIMSRRSEILDGLKEIDAELGTVPAGSERVMLEKDASRIKAEAFQFLPDAEDLREHADGNDNGYYTGLRAIDGNDNDVKSRADEEVADLAKSAGIDPDKLTSRYEGSEPVSKALSDEWRKDELEDIQKNLSYSAETPLDKADELTRAAYDELHRNALQTYRKAERDLERQAGRRKELYRIARLIREGHQFENDFDDAFRKTVNDTLHANELRRLEMGDPSAFQHVTKSVDEQRALSRRYLEAEVDETEGPRRLQLNAALAKLDRDGDLAAQQSLSRKSRDDGLDQ